MENATVSAYYFINSENGWKKANNGITDSLGNYSINGLNSGEYRVNVESEYGILWYGNVSDSSTSTLVNVNKPSTTANNDFIYNSSLSTYSINGTVTDGTNPLSNVTVNLSGDSTASTITDVSGNYSFNDLNPGATCIVTPNKMNYTFTPADRV